MLKRINWKAVLYTLSWLISLGGLVTLMSFIEVQKKDARCKDLRVIIPGIESFIDREEVDLIVQQSIGQLVGRKLRLIDIHKLESDLKKNPYIRSAKVYAEMDGVINIQIAQREPVLRILNVTGQDFYVDNEGYKMPTSMSFTPHVVVANGFIIESFSGKVDTLQTTMAKGLYSTAMYIRKDTLWSEQIEQLFVNNKRELEMIPRVGNHKLVLGDAGSLDQKFKNLLAFYKIAMPHVGWDAYKAISLKYANQIVCEKKGADSIKLKSPVVEKLTTDTIKRTVQDTLTATH